MALSLRTSAPCKVASASRPRVVAVRAGFLNDIGAGIARIFTPTRYGNKDEWNGTETPFTGKISHHELGRKPFRDNWSAGPQPLREKAAPAPMGTAAIEAAERARAEATAAEASAAAEGNIVGYMGDATRRLVNNNFTGDDTEPEAWKEGAAAGGWSKNIHTRGKDGFHAHVE